MGLLRCYVPPDAPQGKVMIGTEAYEIQRVGVGKLAMFSCARYFQLLPAAIVAPRSNLVS